MPARSSRAVKNHYTKGHIYGHKLPKSAADPDLSRNQLIQISNT